MAVNDQTVDLATAKVLSFRRDLHMKTGVYNRSCNMVLADGLELKISATRLLMLDPDQLGAIRYEVTPINRAAQIQIRPYIDAGIKNQDSNWDDPFWETLGIQANGSRAFIRSKTLKTGFDVCTYMQAQLWLDNQEQSLQEADQSSAHKIGFSHNCTV